MGAKRILMLVGDYEVMVPLRRGGICIGIN